MYFVLMMPQISIRHQHYLDGEERCAFLIYCTQQYLCMASHASPVFHAAETFCLVEPNSNKVHPFPGTILYLLVREVLACSVHV